MNVTILREAGYQEAMLGLSLSHNAPVERMPVVAQRLAGRGVGHDKFLRQIVAWLDITAPRYWWSQFDTYGVGVVRQSESTMHTIVKNTLEQSNFEHEIPQDYIDLMNRHASSGNVTAVKSMLPESFLQRRIVMASYAAIANIISQRIHHRLPEWSCFCASMCKLEHPEFLP